MSVTDHSDINIRMEGEGAFLLTQALIVTAGPFVGRICENDDDAFICRDDLRAFERAWMEKAGVIWSRLQSEPAEGDNDDDMVSWEGVECEVVTFGRYLLCRGHYFIPRQFLRPASMKDLIQRYQEIEQVIFDAVWSENPKLSKAKLYELLLEQSYITDEIWDREHLARTTNSGRTVFLCHASADKSFVRQVRNDLAKAGHKPWIDEFEIKVGDSIVEKINEASEQAHSLIIFVSDAALKSEWVGREWKSALSRNLAGRGGRILPALIEECTLPAILADIKYADFRSSYNNGLQEILLALE